MTTTSNIEFNRQRANDRAIGQWLLLCAGMVLAMIVIGGITRLTESGLSIVDWRPVTGFLPPLTEAAWNRVFELYRTSPQYLEINAGMTLAEFRTIFWWEYIHRAWGRLIGLVFFLPFVWFLIRGRVRKSLVPRLIGLFLLGGAQGVLGWYMVRSGLVDVPEVSQYRLAAHLSLAFLIYAALVWTGLSLFFPDPATIADRLGAQVRRLALFALVLIAVTILSGAFVAGTDAGLIFNSFPLMDGAVLPPGYFDHAAAPFEDHGTIQFHHRMLALVSLAAVAALWWRSRWLALAPRARMVTNGLMAMAALQVALGITTLVLVVPVHAAATHQAGAVLLFTLILWFTHELRGRP
ncbi:MAG: heme A synthase [Rhodospirillaceae bacterium]|jgi:cytochrome c oxidase assembly protein subunit 15|nr:heme A synthase [Rhodospirillaceae bacterium]MBT6405873.1 heme A synthase [Rhodospirillaceae bacterium]MBT6536533.1 heme A synthase [Rhodospirillaceae bacterium]